VGSNRARAVANTEPLSGIVLVQCKFPEDPCLPAGPLLRVVGGESLALCVDGERPVESPRGPSMCLFLYHHIGGITWERCLLRQGATCHLISLRVRKACRPEATAAKRCDVEWLTGGTPLERASPLDAEPWEVGFPEL
jgi:hypothetical protein